MVRKALPVEELPVLSEVYRLYDNDELETFVDEANVLLDGDISLSIYDTIQLLLCIANCVVDPRDTIDYYQRAAEQYRLFKWNHHAYEIPAIEDLRPKIKAVRDIVDKECQEWEQAQEDAIDEDDELATDEDGELATDEEDELAASGGPDLTLDGAADATDKSIDLGTAENLADEVGGKGGHEESKDLAFRPKPSKFHASLKLKGGLKPAKSKSELHSLSGISKKNEQRDEVVGDSEMKEPPAGYMYVEDVRGMGFE